MKKYWAPGIPLAFVAGLLTIVVLQLSGFIHLTSTEPNVSGSAAAPEKSAVQTFGISETGSDQSAIRNLQSQLDSLQDELKAAVQERQDIRLQLVALQEAQLDEDFGEQFLPGSGTVITPEDHISTAQRNRNGFGRFGGPTSNEQYNGLIAAGIDPSLALDIKQRSDQWALARLELVDTAEREGWRRSDEFAEKMTELRDDRVDLREELGDDAYDSYLYVSGQDNRVVIQNIITGSAAQLSGIEQGDTFISYADQRVFTSRQLQVATRDGIRNELVPVVVQRNGQYLNLQVPRGPLGVTLGAVRVEPAG